MRLHRRQLLATGAAAALLPLIGGTRGAGAATGRFAVTRTEAAWRAMLSDLEYAVMREEATEQAFTSPLHDLKTPGQYLCRGCDLPLYAARIWATSLTTGQSPPASGIASTGCR